MYAVMAAKHFEFCFSLKERRNVLEMCTHEMPVLDEFKALRSQSGFFSQMFPHHATKGGASGCMGVFERNHSEIIDKEFLKDPALKISPEAPED